MIRLVESTYGKCSVRVMRLNRDRPLHDLQEWTVDILVTGDFAESYTTGDNSRVLATDTMKNLVYSLARDTLAASIEEFGLELSDWLLTYNPQLRNVNISVKSVPWSHLVVGTTTHTSAFSQTSGELQTTTITQERDQAAIVLSGLDNLVIIKTANSGFEGFLRDSHTTLSETNDRLFGTAMRAEWRYGQTTSDFLLLRQRIHDVLLETFATHCSKSVQHTLHAMAEKVLQEVPSIEDIKMIMPNRHCILVDLSRFGKTNPNKVFVPTDQPYGYIEATVRREIES
ncbi:urate oxidase [Edaphobacter sp. HDX4]|uniref:factor-independent urate hydroxylase n=1 Tax=Edaphobacter sp. HDX4 TaxID=2794064 RepID=UPI002FE5BE71